MWCYVKAFALVFVFIHYLPILQSPHIQIVQNTNFSHLSYLLKNVFLLITNLSKKFYLLLKYIKKEETLKK